MSISLENYEEVFSNLNGELVSACGIDNENIKNIFVKIKNKFMEVEKGGDTLKKDNEILKIGVVGQVKAGKSSFLNSLFFEGENVLPRASTPMTAGLTVLEYGEQNEFAVEYYNKGEWTTFLDKAKEYDSMIQEQRECSPFLSEEDIAKMANIPDDLIAAKELVAKCARVAQNEICDKSKVSTESFSDIRDLQNVLEDYVGADGKYTSIVKFLTIRLNDDRLRNLRIVDTPGVNDPVVSREMRTREFLRECHGVFFLSYSGRFFDSTDVNFLTGRLGSQGIGTVVLVASKFDSVLQDVGTKFPDNLGNAIVDCEVQLKKQLQSNLSTSDYRGDDPIFIASSGIGYSIANKPKDRWDATENHVVSRMKNFYPSYFSNDQDIKDTFFNLSQMDVLRKDYLDGVFVKNRDSIIKNKVNSYFSNSSGELHKILKDGKEEIETRIRTLESSDISALEATRKANIEIVSKIRREINSLANVSDEKAERYRKECWNSFEINWTGNVPTTLETITVRRERDFIGSAKMDVSYPVVNKQRLIDNIVSEIERSAKQLDIIWKEDSGKLMSEIGDKVGNIITECELNDTEAIIESDALRTKLEEVLASMGNSSTIETSDIKNDIRSHMAMELQNLPDVPTATPSMKEVDARNWMAKKASEVEIAARDKAFQIIDAARGQYKEALRKAKEETVSVFKDRKDEFISRVEAAIEDHVEKLEADMKNKTAELEKYKDSLNVLERIGGML